MAAVTYRETLLTVQDVSLKLGGNTILRDVDCEVKDIVGHGQVVGLLGPSGVGKTQLFRILAGLQAPDAGSVRITGKGIPVEVGKVGVIAQHYPLFPHRTVLGNLVVAGRQAGMGRAAAKEKARALLAKLNLAERAGYYPAQLSGGQRQRVAIAQQLMCSEHFLLMDEPFSGLDPNAIDTVCELVAQVRDLHELNTVVIVTHDIRAAIKVADTLWLMGRERDVVGDVIPGARIVETYDLIARGLAWHSDISKVPEYDAVYREVRERFRTL